MCDQSLAVYEKFVLLGFAAEDRMIFEDQAPCASSGLALKEESGGYAANPTTDNDAIIDLARLDDVFR